MKKNSQLQISETISIIFVFLILVVIGLVFYVRVIKSNISLEQDEASQLRSVAIAQQVMFLPEIQCSEGNEVENCIDTLKLDSAQKIMRENELYYFDLLGYSEVNVTQIYPGPKKWSIYSRKLPDFKNKFFTRVPISLRDPVTDQIGFGILTIETSTK